MMIDRREALRVKQSCRVEYRKTGSLNSWGTTVSDISEKGVRMPLFHSLPEGTRLELKIYSGEDQSAILTEGKVMWLEFDHNTSAPYVCGIRIERISSSGRSRLVQLLLTALCQHAA